MQISTAQFTVAEYVQQMKTGDIKVNKDYQRSSAIWPPAARSYLIDTILHGYPVPKLSLFQKTDLKSRTTVKEIVDGQQRSQAIRDFYEGVLRISGHSEFRGKTFEQLDDDEKSRFLSYAVTADIFAAATDVEIREVFRRINSYNVPLNPAETRHATFQGEFKWFIVGQCERHSQTLKSLGVFSEPQLGRMYDAALFSEVCRTLLYGIDHASEPKLKELYRDRDEELPEESILSSAIADGVRALVEWTGLHGTSLFKPFNVYSLLTVVAHLTRGFEKLQGEFRVSSPAPISVANSEAGLARLATALDEGDPESPYKSFVVACAAKTNRKDPRRTRFSWIAKAASGRRLT